MIRRNLSHRMSSNGPSRRRLSSSTAAERLSRRAFLNAGTLWLLGSAIGGGCLRSLEALDNSGAPLLRVGLLTDLHYADRPPAGTRYYRETLSKLRECVNKFNAIGPDFVVEFGDLIDTAETVEGEVGHLKTIESRIRSAPEPTALCARKSLRLEPHQGAVRAQFRSQKAILLVRPGRFPLCDP